MEACAIQGASLLQRVVSTATNVTVDLTAGTEAPGLHPHAGAITSGNVSSLHPLLALVTSNSSASSGMSSQAILAQLLLQEIAAAAKQPDILTNSSIIETTSRDELVRSLTLNICVFVGALLVWTTCCCHGPIFRAGNEENEQHLEHEGSIPKRNYLMYLRICMYMCVTLTVLNLLFVMQHGLVFAVFLKGESILSVSEDVAIEDIFLMTFLDGVIVLIFSELFQKLIEVPQQGPMQEKISRTIWLQGLPTHDSLRWGAPFKLNDVEVGRVQHDLVDALTDALHFKDGDVQHSLFHTGGVGPAHAGSRSVEVAPIAHRMAPSKPAPVDMKETQWRCYLDDGNPYYVNLATGQVQWDMPEVVAASQGRRWAESHYVEDVQVALVVDEWKQVYTNLQQAQELIETYEDKYQRLLPDLTDAQRPVLRRLVSHPAAWWYWRRARAYEASSEELQEKLKNIRTGKKLIAGSAFVTLKDASFRDRLLRDSADEAYWWILPSSSAFFSFGRPPFASVTLTCKRAPHPHDIIWENLHVSKWWRAVVFWTLSSFILFVMVVIITVVRISEFVLPVITLVHGELDRLEQTDLWQAYVPNNVQNLLSIVNTKVFWASLLEQMPSLILLFINAVLVPLAIDFVIGVQRAVTHSQAEHARMLVNFFFLFTNTVVVPFCGVASLNELLSLLVRGLQDYSVFEPIESIIFASNGWFALKYLMSAALFSNVNQILQLSQHLSRWSKRALLAVTPSERELFNRPWPFYWGYWYAWTLSIFSLGITVSVACPSTLPLTAVFFFVKYGVDKYNLDTGVYASGTDVEGSLAFRVVRYLRFIVALWWIAIGACAYSISKFEAFGHHKLLSMSQRHSLLIAGIIFMVMGALTLLVGWWLTARQLSWLMHTGSRPDFQHIPSFWHALGEVLCLVDSLESRLKPSLEDSGGTGTAPQDVAGARQSPVAQSPSRSPPTALCWNGPKLLNLE